MDKYLSSDYSWEYVKADKCVAQIACELVYARLVPTGATTDSALYSGRDAGGKLITGLKRSGVDDLEFSPPVPVYCPEGLFVDVGSSVDGILVVWRNL